MKLCPLNKNLLILVIAMLLCFGSMSASAASDRRTIAPEPIPLAGGVLKPESPGTVSYSASGATLDASNVSEGYVMIKYSGNSSKAKVRIARSGSGVTYTYNLRTDGNYEVYALTEGNGTYQITVYNHVSGDQYAQALTQKIEVSLRSATLPFLYPSQFVNFTGGSNAVKKANEISKTASGDLEIVSGVYNFVIGSISYDNEKAKQAAAGNMGGYVPVIDNTLSSGKGICFDYAALMASMLRSQGIPTRMEFGYVSGDVYHAWISVYITDIGWINGVIQFDGKSWTRMDPTFASSEGANSKFVGDGYNYHTLYRY